MHKIYAIVAHHCELRECLQEELAEGLHLIDFEQLKIENQSLNEKIEERNEELAKLRKKTATTVQVALFCPLLFPSRVFMAFALTRKPAEWSPSWP